MFFFSRFPKHIDPIRRWALLHHASMSFDPISFHLVLAHAGAEVMLYPRFAGEHAGRTAYFDHFSGDFSFVGWLPYRLRKWALASDKLAFKRVARARGLRVPLGWQEGAPVAESFIVKPTRGSFGLGIRGPFGPLSPYHADEAEQSAFFEQFIVGQSAKAWFWNSTLSALEILAPPVLFGDGKHTLHEISQANRGNFDLKLSLDSSKDILRWQGLDADTIAAPGRKVQLDYRYATPYDRITLKNRDVLGATSQTIRRQFEVAGRMLHEEIDESVRANTAFTLDAVIDEHERVWFLEMNSHPMIHPAIYAPMLASLFEHAIAPTQGGDA